MYMKKSIPKNQIWLASFTPAPLYIRDFALYVKDLYLGCTFVRFNKIESLIKIKKKIC
jgi:hypothetical protein